MYSRSLLILIILAGGMHDLAAQEDQPQIPAQLTIEAAKALLRFNPQLQTKNLEIEVERADIIEAEKYPNPTFSLGSEGLVLDSNRGPFLSRLQPSILFRQEILTAGKRQKRVRVEQADAEIASIETADLHRRLLFDLKQVYYQVVLAQEDLGIGREILEQMEEVVRLNQARFEQGEISGGELRRTQAAQYPFFADVVNAEVQLQNAKTQLLALLGRTGFNQNFEAVDRFSADFVPPPLALLKEIAVRERPDLAAQRARVIRQASAIELEKARSTPNIWAFGGYQRELGIGGPLIGIDMPLFVFNRNEGPIYRAQAEGRREQSAARFKEIKVFKEVELAVQQLGGTALRIAALEGEYLEKALQAREITESAYRLGEASLIEFLDAQRTYAETVLLYNRTLYDSEISRAGLELAIGEDL
ncbi:MAG: TolC family protein [Acidobacteriota bacterium]